MWRSAAIPRSPNPPTVAA
uniref:Uncharacterized protein n=1 Tax=Anopheles epiroticus TaxID=199890 RepID=A0A182P4L1_9DIPT